MQQFIGRPWRCALRVAACLTCLSGIAASALAAAESGVSPATLGVVVNTADPLSVAIADYYLAQRHVPSENLIAVHFEAGRPVLGPSQYDRLKEHVAAHTPASVQAYLLTWALPYRTPCMSITTAFASGFDESYCAKGCGLSKASPYFDSDSTRPYDELKWRPAMSLAATDLAQAKELIDRGIAADGTHPAGTGYLVRTSDKRRNVRAAAFPALVDQLGKSVALRYVETDFIEHQDDVLFYFTGASEVRGIESNRFLPGAIADHLTSGGGKLVGGKQMSAMRWLTSGATGSYGTVEEPCAVPQKFPVPGIVIRRYLAGETLLEAYAKSVEIPAQGIFIGEPLARPYAKQQ